MQRFCRLAALLLYIGFRTHAFAQLRLDSVVSLHGNGNDVVTAMAVDHDGSVYLTGRTTSFDLATPGALLTHRASSSIYAVETASGKSAPLMLPSGTTPLSVAADPRQNGTLYFSTYTGLFKTTDSGNTWTALADGLPAMLGPYTIAVAPSNPSIVYASFGDARFFRSSDAGLTWTAMSPTPTFSGTLIVDPANPAHVLIDGSQTDDGGATWVPGPFVYKIVFDPLNPRVVYAASGLKLVKSTDSGRTFVPLNFTGIPASIVPDSMHPGTVYVGASGPEIGVYKSTDAGSTWARVSALEIVNLAQDPATGTLYTWYDGVFRSADGYKTVTPVTTDQPFYVGSIVFPVPGVLWTVSSNDSGDAFLSKQDRNGQTLFTTYIGGKYGSAGTAIQVDAAGGIYLGINASVDLPVTGAIRDSTFRAIYLVKVAGDGSRIDVSTRITGAADAISALLLDDAGNIYITGTTGDGFPTTPGAAQPVYGFRATGPTNSRAFAAEIAADATTLVFATYLGPGPVDRGHAIVLDTSHNLYIAGTQMWKLNPAGTALLWSKKFNAEFLAATLDAAGNLYACGGTSGDIFTSASAFQKTPAANYGILTDTRFNPPAVDAFLMKFNPAGDVLYSTLLGGRGGDAATAILVDDQGQATVAGYTRSADLPMRYPLQGPFGDQHGFLTKFNRDASDLLYSTYTVDARPFGAIALGRDVSGSVVVAGNAPGIGGSVLTGRFTGTGAPPPIYVDAVLNSANLLGGPLAPDEWITVRGGGFDPDSRLLINDQPLEGTVISGTEISARLPAGFVPVVPTAVRVDSGDISSPAVLVDSAPVTPSLFIRDGTALVFNSDGSRNSQANPAAQGSQVALVANGLGILDSGPKVRVNFSTGAWIPATIQILPVPGLTGASYTLIIATVPALPAGVFPLQGAWFVTLEFNSTTYPSLPEYKVYIFGSSEEIVGRFGLGQLAK